MFQFSKQVFLGLLSFDGLLCCIATIYDCTKCLSINNESCITRPTCIDLNIEEFHFYLLMVKFVRSNGSYYLLDDLSSSDDLSHVSKENGRCKLKSL